MCDISLVVVSYNSDYSKLFRTLYSIIIQKNIDFEIIIADDGSENFQKAIIENWFYENKFINYKIVKNSQNNGTVVNALSGIRLARGKYIKQLSPGDFLYNNTVLNKLLLYLEKNDLKLCFGKAVSYKFDIESKKIEIVNSCAPRNLKPYIKHNRRKIQKNYLINRDYVNGMAVVGETKLIKNYLEKLVGHVKYAEDCIYILMVANGIELFYWDECLIWYEIGAGISTSKSDVWGKRIYDDNRECFKILKEECPEWEKAYKINFEKSFLYYLHKVKRKVSIQKSLHAEANNNVDLMKLKEILGID